MKRILTYKLFEDHYQTEIPFGQRKKEGVIDKKPQHIQVLDAFEEFAKQTKFNGIFVSKGKYEDYLTPKLKSDILKFDTYKGDMEISEFYINFFNAHPLEEHKEYYNKKWFEENEISFDDKGMGWADPMNTNMDDILTKKGRKKFDEFKSWYAEEIEDEHGFISALNAADKDGLKIYRSITLKERHDYKFDTSTLYDQIVDQYKGAGYYWTFDEDAPESYHGSLGAEYILYGRVRLQDINWKNTYFKNIYNLRQESEIEIDEGIIKIEKIFNKDEKKFLPLEEPLYINP